MIYDVTVEGRGTGVSITWRFNGRVHCEHGPARIHSDGSYEFYLDGKWCSQGAWEAHTRRTWRADIPRFFGRQGVM